MKIWRMRAKSNEIESVVLVDREIVFPLYFENKFEGKSVDEWGSIKVKTLGKKVKCDVLNFSSGSPIVTTREIDGLSTLLDKNAQVLPVTYNERGQLYIINVTRVNDCLDYEKSEISRYTTGRISSVDKFSFKYEVVLEANIFKIPELLKTHIFVSDQFKCLVEDQGLVGFDFEEVWDSSEYKSDGNNEGQGSIYDQLPGPEVTFAEVHNALNKGLSAVSETWKIQKSNDGEIILGQLQSDGSYKWIAPVFYPPILLELKWKVTDRSDV